jgi:hypothetical protein
LFDPGHDGFPSTVGSCCPGDALDRPQAQVDQRTELVADVLAAKIQTLPAVVARTLIWDQGHEMAEHARLTVATGVKVYFCDPKSPWQRVAPHGQHA